MNGIIPLFLMQVTIPQSYPMILLALTVNPNVDNESFKSILSLIDIGIPNKGGKYIY